MTDEMDEDLDAAEEAAKDNRVHPRFRLNQGVTIRLSSGEFVKAQATNISIGGVHVEYGSPADEGLVFDLCFDLPFSREFKRVYAKGKVTRSICIGARDIYGIAFRFEGFAKDSEAVLEEYIDLRSGQESGVF